MFVEKTVNLPKFIDKKCPDRKRLPLLRGTLKKLLAFFYDKILDFPAEPDIMMIE